MYEIFKQSDFNRQFELSLIENFDKINVPIYLSIGTEHIPPCIKYSLDLLGIQKYNIFPQHRCHSYYLTFIGNALGLAAELCGLEQGCNRGMGGSASVSDKEHRFFGHSGLLGDQVPIAVGMAHASQVPTVVILGDAAVEEDYVLGALGFAATKKCPILFICEDNNLSILTEKEVRRSWHIVDVAEGFEITSYNISDDPGTITDFVVRLFLMVLDS
jgi:acetoin:2,6-dichlorophenolindophenol oxidoreductase subunit alpha